LLLCGLRIVNGVRVAIPTVAISCRQFDLRMGIQRLGAAIGCWTSVYKWLHEDGDIMNKVGCILLGFPGLRVGAEV
jgi:hypothetical protein